MQGIQRLLCLSLDGTPSRELAEPLAEVWTDALWPTKAWNEARDVPRLAAAFRKLTVSCVRWPAPAELLANYQSDPPAGPALPSPDRLRARERSVRTGREVLDKLAAEFPWLKEGKPS